MKTTQEKIEVVLKKICFCQSTHNEIYFKHLRAFLKILIEDETGDWKIIKYKTSISLGIGDRYVKQYFRGLVAWNIADLDDQDKVVWKINFDEVKI